MKALIPLLLCAALPLQAAIDPAWLDAKSAQQALKDGSLSSEQLVQHYLNQIEQHNQQGHQLAAIIDINPDALAIARKRDQERSAGKALSPLHGLPVVLKANIATADSMPTTAGALALQGFVTEQDAELVAQLRAAGAVILAKTNLSEWANFRGTGSASGWSALGGQTRNPHVLSHTPCGSSSGSAVAVAADFVLLAVGTETDGSIICPAAMNGVVGIKPTRGSVSGHGIIPIASAQDIAGPMSRKVYDAALLLDAMLTAEAKQQFAIPLSAASQQAAATQQVVVIRAYDDRDEAIGPMLDQLVEQLLAAGIAVQQVDAWQVPAELYQSELEVLVYEYKRDLEQWLRDFNVPAPVNSLQGIVDFNHAKGEEALAFFGQEYLQQAAAVNLSEQAPYYQKALAQSRELAEALLDEHLTSASAIILPSYGPAWPIDHQQGDQFNFGTSTAAAVAGYPSINLPAGFSGPFPLGVSLIGSPWSEPELLALAQLLEQQLDAYRQPAFLATPSAQSSEKKPTSK
ncbi:amidase [Alkalimonas sp.]|uniref:amidase n=1 Tax=Alkalimonas sp. TaxID=1872453 RepID=UPI00263A3E69|nr:amidase [Alkalimonas sp.]MCC5826168.1 amidase [Alkalimonas sp.]